MSVIRRGAAWLLAVTAMALCALAGGVHRARCASEGPSDTTPQTETVAQWPWNTRAFCTPQLARDDAHPCWSPDGQRLAFAARNGGQMRLFLFDPASSRTTRLAPSVEGASHPSWSGDGRLIAFGGSPQGSGDLFVVDVRSGDLTELTEGPDDDFAPEYVPGGDAVLFQRTVTDPGAGAAVTHLCIVSSGDRSVTCLTDEIVEKDGSGKVDEPPIWLTSVAPRGGGILACLVPGPDAPFVWDPAGAEWEPLHSQVMPAWSPDGKRLVYVTDNGSAPSQRLVIRAVGQGSPEEVLLELPREAGSVGAVAWAPTGDRIALAYGAEPRGVGGVPPGGDVRYVAGIASASGGRFELVKGRPRALGCMPRWSPDGSTLAVSRCCAEDVGVDPALVPPSGVDLLSVQGGIRVRELTVDALVNLDLTWSPSGEWLAWAADYGDRQEVTVARADGSEVVELRRLVEQAAERDQ